VNIVHFGGGVGRGANSRKKKVRSTYRKLPSEVGGLEVEKSRRGLHGIHRKKNEYEEWAGIKTEGPNSLILGGGSVQRKFNLRVKGRMRKHLPNRRELLGRSLKSSELIEGKNISKETSSRKKYVENINFNPE